MDPGRHSAGGHSPAPGTPSQPTGLASLSPPPRHRLSRLLRAEPSLQGQGLPRTTLSALGQREQGCVRYTWSMIFSLTWEMVSQLRTLTGTASTPSSWTITLTVCTEQRPSCGGALALARPKLEAGLGLLLMATSLVEEKGQSVLSPDGTRGLTFPALWLRRTDNRELLMCSYHNTHKESQEHTPRTASPYTRLPPHARCAGPHTRLQQPGNPGGSRPGVVALRAPLQGSRTQTLPWAGVGPAQGTGANVSP